MRLLLPLFAALTACDADAPPPSVAPEPMTARIEVATSDADYAASRFVGRVSLDEVEDLVLRVTLSGAGERSGVLLLEVYAPGGGRFQVYREPIHGDVVELVIPIAGTEFTKRQLTGEITLVAAVEGRPEVLGTSTLELVAGGSP